MITTADLNLALIQAGAIVSISAFVFSRGLVTRASNFRYLRRRPGLLLRSLISVDILVPLIAVATVAFIAPPGTTAIGLLVLASSPAAPLALKKILKAGGKTEYAISLHIVLASLAIITTPITLTLLSGIAGFQPEASPLAVAVRVGLSTLLPIVAGMIFGRLFPMLARRMVKPLEVLSSITLALVVIVVLRTTYHQLLAMDIKSYVAIGLMITAALATGHLMAGGRTEEQTTLALESATRNVGLALLIASTFSTLEKILPVLIPYLVLSAIIGFIYVRYRRMGRIAAGCPGPQ